MGVKLVIPGRLPGLNDYIDDNRADKHVAAKRKKEVEEEICWHILSQLKGKKFNAVRLRFGWYEGNMKRDKDNIAFAKKFVLDALQKAGTLKGDGWKQVIGFVDDFYVDRERPRVEIEIEAV
jgi:Holliday junction resolvase RusA-like endonuclease